MPFDSPAYRWLMFQGIVMQASYFGLRPMVTYRAIDLGVSTGEIGLLAGAFGGLSLLVAIPVGRWLDRIGPGRGTVIGISVEALGAFFALFASNFTILFIAATVMGLGHVIAMPGHTMYIATHFSPDRRMEMYNNYSTMVSIGQSLGPPSALFVAAYFATSGGPNQVNSEAGLIIALIFCLSALPAALRMRESKGEHAKKHPPKSREERRAHKRERKASGKHQSTWGIMTASAIVVASQDVLITFLPVWAVDRGVTPSVVGWLLASRAIFTLLIRLSVMRMIARFGRNQVLIFSIFVGAIGFALLPVFGANSAWISMIFLGMGLGIAQPITLVMLMDSVDESSRGAALGVRMFGHRLGQLFLPLAIGGIAGLIGMNGAWVISGFVMGIAVLLSIFTAPPEIKPPKSTEVN